MRPGNSSRNAVAAGPCLAMLAGFALAGRLPHARHTRAALLLGLVCHLLAVQSKREGIGLVRVLA
jgi:1,4-dihydroxy-2-naphthoate octaprenyltransferase